MKRKSKPTSKTAGVSAISKPIKKSPKSKSTQNHKLDENKTKRGKARNNSTGVKNPSFSLKSSRISSAVKTSPTLVNGTNPSSHSPERSHSSSSSDSDPTPNEGIPIYETKKLHRDFEFLKSKDGIENVLWKSMDIFNEKQKKKRASVNSDFRPVVFNRKTRGKRKIHPETNIDSPSSSLYDECKSDSESVDTVTVLNSETRRGKRRKIDKEIGEDVDDFNKADNNDISSNKSSCSNSYSSNNETDSEVITDYNNDFVVDSTSKVDEESDKSAIETETEIGTETMETETIDENVQNDEKSMAPSTSYVVTIKSPKTSKQKIYRCKICKKDSKAKADLIKHIRVHTGERPYKCKTCGAGFIQVTALRGHETIHTGAKQFACDICSKKFAIKDRLRLHMRVHTGEKPHPCPKCDLTFARRSQVGQHMRMHDPTKNKFKCKECGLSFASYHILKSHTNSHLGIKEFQCFACGKKFLRIEGMYKHIRTVHHGNRPYTCNICGKAFKGHLQQHMRLHNGVRPYSCHLCDAAFTQNSQLTVHIRVHTGERPYKCQVCGVSFAHSSACKIHMRSHTGEKPFTCVLCQQKFSQLPHLKKHMKCVHGADKPYLCDICKDFFKTQMEIDMHRKSVHNILKSPEEEAQESVEESALAKLRNRLAVLLYRISSEDRRKKFGFGEKIIDLVLKESLKFSGHKPVSDSTLTILEELRQNVLQLLRWTIPQDTMEEYHKNNMTVDEVLDILTA